MWPNRPITTNLRLDLSPEAKPATPRGLTRRRSIQFSAKSIAVLKAYLDE
jgi:hypothetical protein